MSDRFSTPTRRCALPAPARRRLLAAIPVLLALAPVAAQAQGVPAPTGNAAGPTGATRTACDAACVRSQAERATQACAPRIEAEAPTDYEWVTRPHGGIFQQAEEPPRDSAGALIRYRGDSIRFLGPHKEWVRVTYECGFDAASQKVEFVRVRLGRLDRPPPPGPPVAAAPGGPTPAAARALPQTLGDAGRPSAPPAVAARAQPQAPAPKPAPAKKAKLDEPSDIEMRQVESATAQPRR